MPEPTAIQSNVEAALTEEFINGKVLLFNKPLFWTSFNLVSKVRVILKHRLKLGKIKVGHAGTLDPLATGLLIVCTGKETKNIEKYQAQPKEYLAKIHLGATTPSFDLETDVDATFPIAHIDQDLTESVLKAFLGNQLQEPPGYSARMVNGTRAYKLARKGEAPVLQSKPIEIYEITLVRFALPVIEVRIVCSKGTYIRSLARDIGSRLGSGGHLSGLVRKAIGDFSLDNALDIEEFERNLVFL